MTTTTPVALEESEEPLVPQMKDDTLAKQQACDDGSSASVVGKETGNPAKVSQVLSTIKSPRKVKLKSQEKKVVDEAPAKVSQVLSAELSTENTIKSPRKVTFKRPVEKVVDEAQEKQNAAALEMNSPGHELAHEQPAEVDVAPATVTDSGTDAHSVLSAELSTETTIKSPRKVTFKRPVEKVVDEAQEKGMNSPGPELAHEQPAEVDVAPAAVTDSGTDEDPVKVVHKNVAEEEDYYELNTEEEALSNEKAQPVSISDQDSQSRQHKHQIPPKVTLSSSHVQFEHPLLLAIRSGHIGQMEQELHQLSSSAIATIKDHHGRNVLHYALFLGSIKTCQILLQYPSTALQRDFDEKKKMLMQRQRDIRRLKTREDLDIYTEWIENQSTEWQRLFQIQLEKIYVDLFRASDDHQRNFAHYMVGRGHFISGYESCFQRCRSCEIALKKSSFQLHAADAYGWTPLHYATQGHNLPGLKWLFAQSRPSTSFLSPQGLQTLLNLSPDSMTRRILIQKLDRMMLTPKPDDPAQRRQDRNACTLILLENREDVNIASGTLCQTPLHQACADGQFHIVQFLIERRQANAYVKDSNGWTALHYACGSSMTHQHIDIAKYLIQQKSTVGNLMEQMTSKGRRALHFAAQQHSSYRDKNAMALSTVLVQALLEAGAEIDPVDHQELTPFHYACERGQKETVAYFLTQTNAQIHSSSSQRKCSNALHLATAAGQHEIVRMLCRWDCEHGNHLIKSLNSQHKTPFDLASGPKLRKEMSNLWYASLQGHFEQVRQYLPKDHDDDDEQEDTTASPLWDPIRINEQSFRWKKSALHFAIQGLAEASKDNTELHHHHRYIQVLQHLFRCGADFHLPDSRGITPTLLLSRYGMLFVLEKLVLWTHDRFDFDAMVDRNGNSSLHYAYAYGHDQLAHYLQHQRGLDLSAVNYDQQTPVDVAGLKNRLLPRSRRK